MNEHVKPETVAADAPPHDPYTIELSKPLETHSGAVRVLKLRELNAGDFVDINVLPFNLAKGAEHKLDFKAGMTWLSRLTGHDEIILRRLPRRDWLKCMNAVSLLIMEEGDTVGN